VVYNGVDTDRFHPGTDRSREDIRRRHGIGGEFLILFVSNNFRMKGLAYLIRALALLKSVDHAPFRLLVLGRDHPGSYARLAERMGVSEAVIFGGSTREPEKYYGAADLLVHPTFYDACSLTVLEALASGLPVVTTASNGACGLLTSNEGGRVVENARDVKALAEAIRYFFDKQRREDASRMARRKAEACSEKSNFDQIVEILKEAAALKGVLSGGVKGRSGDGRNALG
jgi:UDP-glucose:(heptosyl)LPS alpha-1,3-glucosyltransferase